MSGFGGTVKLTGESEYRKALSDITSNLKVLNSEMKVITSQYDRNDKSVENLSRQNVTLNKRVEEQKQKVEILKKALADAELKELAKVLIADVEREYKDYNAFLKSRGQSAGEMKKNSVITELKAYALEKGYGFDEDEWGKAIDDLVTFTRNVNAKT